MADFVQFCNQFSRLDEAATYDLFTNLKTRSLKEGDCLLKEGEVCRHLFFVHDGLLKMFFSRDDKEFIMRFFSENLLFSAFESYLTQTPSRFNIMALEPTTVTLISYDRMEELCKLHHSMETFFRKLVSI